MMPLDEAEAKGWRCAPTCSRGKRCPQAHFKKLEWGGYWVGGPTTHVAAHQYVTGRAGRATWREVALCAPCAEAWAAKHLPRPPALAGTP